MNEIKLTINNESETLIWIIVSDMLILKNREIEIFSIYLSSIESITVERSLDPLNPLMFELVIKGGCKILASTLLSSKNAFRTQKWLELNIKKTNNNKKYYRYRPHFFRMDVVEYFWRLVAFLCIFVLLLFITYMYPRLNQIEKNQEENQMTYEFLFNEGERLVELDRLTDGLNKLEDAQSIKNTEEVQKAINDAYLERAQFYFDSKEYKKAKLDILQIKNIPHSAEKMLDFIERYDNPSPYFSKININQIENLFRNRWAMTFIKETVKQKSNIRWIAKKYDVINGVILNCTVSGTENDQIETIQIKSEMMQKDDKEDILNFEVISKEFLSICYKIPFTIDNPGLVETWYNLWYPKMASSNYQVTNQISGIQYHLLGEKGVRVVEIKMAELSKTP